MCTVNATEFRSKMGAYLDRSRSGEELLVKRGDCLFAIVPIREEGTFVPSPELNAAIEEARKEYREGKYVVCRTDEEIDALLESLS